MAESSPVSTSQPLGSRSCGRAGLQGHVPDEEGALCRLGSLSTSAREDRTCAQTPSPTPPAARGRGRATLVGEQPFLADAPATWLSWPPSSPGLVGSQREDAGLCAVSTRAPLSPERTGGRRRADSGGPREAGGPGEVGFRSGIHLGDWAERNWGCGHHPKERGRKSIQPRGPTASEMKRLALVTTWDQKKAHESWTEFREEDAEDRPHPQDGEGDERPEREPGDASGRPGRRSSGCEWGLGGCGGLVLTLPPPPRSPNAHPLPGEGPLLAPALASIAGQRGPG